MKCAQKHALDLNLDDERVLLMFIAEYGTTKGGRLANMLGLSGDGSIRLADAISCYAWNAYTAMLLRKKGDINKAKYYETINDRIYKESIQPVCNCW